MQTQLPGWPGTEGLEQSRVHVHYQQTIESTAPGTVGSAAWGPAPAVHHKPKGTASVCSACWESAVPYAMGQVQGPDSGVVSDMERPRQDPYPDGAGE